MTSVLPYRQECSYALRSEGNLHFFLCPQDGVPPLTHTSLQSMQLPDTAKTHFSLKNNPGELNALGCCSRICFWMISLWETSKSAGYWVKVWTSVVLCSGSPNYFLENILQFHFQQPYLRMPISSHLHSHCVFSSWKVLPLLDRCPHTHKKKLSCFIQLLFITSIQHFFWLSLIILNPPFGNHLMKSWVNFPLRCLFFSCWFTYLCPLGITGTTYTFVAVLAFKFCDVWHTEVPKFYVLKSSISFCDFLVLTLHRI